jgi:hypothetical protein
MEIPLIHETQQDAKNKDLPQAGLGKPYLKIIEYDIFQPSGY